MCQCSSEHGHSILCSVQAGGLQQVGSKLQNLSFGFGIVPQTGMADLMEQPRPTRTVQQLKGRRWQVGSKD
jgi:hypothetical protein